MSLKTESSNKKPNLCIVVLAAGEGRRMRSGLPKVLHEICGRPMINYVLDAALKMGAKKTIAVISRKRPEVAESLGQGVCVAYQTKPLGTADAVKAAEEEITSSTEDVIVLYGDTPLIREETIQRLYEQHLKAGVPCTVLTTFLSNPKGYGRILRDEFGRFIGIVEDKDATFQQRFIPEVNTGMYCFKREALLDGLKHVAAKNQSGEFYLTDVCSWLFRNDKKIEACMMDDSREVLGVNSQNELMQAQGVIRERILEGHVASGVRIMDFSTTFIDTSVKIGRGTQIFPFTSLEKNVTVGKNCSLGPFCHLREGSVLRDGVSVGNFTEIKNSSLGQGTFMRHMSYLGDTRVGKNVNIGAGTVVANFDGRRKHETVIKDRVFVGCDSVLIAPVVVGRDAVLGAGSVVTKEHNVADGATVIGVPAREIKRVKKVKVKKHHNA